MKRVLLFIIALLFLPIVANAYDVEVNGIFYNLHGDEAEVTHSVASVGISSAVYPRPQKGDVVVPESIVVGNKKYKVTSIGYGAYEQCLITSIEIPNSVKSIGSRAFENCLLLTDVNIPSSVESIEKNAFVGCYRLTSAITLPDAITKIENGTFFGCSKVSAIILSSRTKTIGIDAFRACSSLKSINIPESVTSIGEYAFAWCGIETIKLPSQLTSIANYLFNECSDLTQIDIPEGITSIGKGAFARCYNLSSIIFPSSLTFIDELIFSYCNAKDGNHLKDVYCLATEVPEVKVDYYGDYFWTSLDWAYQPKDVTLHVPESAIEEYKKAKEYKKFTIVPLKAGDPGYLGYNESKDNIQFADAKVKAICVGNWDTDHDSELSKQEAAAVTSIGTVFSEDWEISSFDELQYFTGLTAIDDNAFSGCDGLTAITLPNTIATLGTYAFSGCDGLTSFVIPSSVTTLNDAVFNYCAGLTSIIIPKSVTRMGYNPLNGCSALTSIQVESGNPNFDSRNGCNAIIYSKSDILVSGCKNTVIPDGIKTIWQYAFGGCEELTSITIPASVTTFGNYAFFGCDNLEEIHSEIIQPSAFNATVFGNTDILTSATLYVPYGTAALYRQTDGWKNFQNIVEQGNSETAEVGEIVDLGLSVRWADRNLGATDMTSTGTYFAWGDTEARTSYSESDYVFNGGNLPQDIIGTGYDAARQLWGGEWRMPTYEEIEELISKCTWTYTTKNGVNGYLVDNSMMGFDHFIFFPMPGYKEETTSHTSSTYYWTGNQSANNKSKAMSLTQNDKNVEDIRQYLGALIRPVWDESSHYIPTDVIQFADAKVKAICVANWDTDHDGELSKQEAAAVTSIGKVFSDEWEITSFDELQYFTGLTAIDDNAFAGCAGLTSITLPNTVTSLRTYAFSGCDGLTSFVIPSSVTTLNDAVFNYCSSLTSIIIPKSVTRMGFNPLNGCSALTSIQVESGNPNFDSRNGCNAIIYGKSGILVSGCKNTVIPDGIKTIWQYAFGGCEELTSITIPASVTTFGDYAFFGCDNLEEIHSEIVQPSAINATVFGNTDIFTTATLYVPTGTKAQYQATDGWKDFRNIVEQGGTATDIASATITIENASYPYTGSAIEPAVSVVYSGTTLVKGTDYSLSYKNNIMAGTATVTATGVGNYTGTVTATFTIDKAQLVVTAQSIMREYGEENPGFTCKISGFMNEDTVLDLTKLPVIATTASTMSPVGTYDITVSGGEARNYSFNYEAGTLTIVPKGIATATLTVADSCVYTGQPIRPDVTVQLDGRVLTEGTDYSLTFTNNIMPGIASLTIMGAGNYTGTVTKTFVIFTPTAIGDVDADATKFDVYDMSGRKIRRHVTTFESLPKGVYIVGGRKLVVK